MIASSRLANYQSRTHGPTPRVSFLLRSDSNNALIFRNSPKSDKERSTTASWKDEQIPWTVVRRRRRRHNRKPKVTPPTPTTTSIRKGMLQPKPSWLRAPEHDTTVRKDHRDVQRREREAKKSQREKHRRKKGSVRSSEKQKKSRSSKGQRAKEPALVDMPRTGRIFDSTLGFPGEGPDGVTVIACAKYQQCKRRSHFHRKKGGEPAEGGARAFKERNKKPCDIKSLVKCQKDVSQCAGSHFHPPRQGPRKNEPGAVVESLEALPTPLVRTEAKQASHTTGWGPSRGGYTAGLLGPIDEAQQCGMGFEQTSTDDAQYLGFLSTSTGGSNEQSQPSGADGSPLDNTEEVEGSPPTLPGTTDDSDSEVEIDANSFEEMTPTAPSADTARLHPAPRRLRRAPVVPSENKTDWKHSVPDATHEGAPEVTGEHETGDPPHGGNASTFPAILFHHPSDTASGRLAARAARRGRAPADATVYHTRRSQRPPLERDSDFSDDEEYDGDLEETDINSRSDGRIGPETHTPPNHNTELPGGRHCAPDVAKSVPGTVQVATKIPHVLVERIIYTTAPTGSRWWYLPNHALYKTLGLVSRTQVEPLTDRTALDDVFGTHTTHFPSTKQRRLGLSKWQEKVERVVLEETGYTTCDARVISLTLTTKVQASKVLRNMSIVSADGHITPHSMTRVRGAVNSVIDDSLAPLQPSIRENTIVYVYQWLVFSQLRAHLSNLSKVNKPVFHRSGRVKVSKRATLSESRSRMQTSQRNMRILVDLCRQGIIEHFGLTGECASRQRTTGIMMAVTAPCLDLVYRTMDESTRRPIITPVFPLRG